MNEWTFKKINVIKYKPIKNYMYIVDRYVGKIGNTFNIIFILLDNILIKIINFEQINITKYTLII